LWYIQKERVFAYAGLRLNVPPGVFHPGLFFTTTMCVDYLQSIDFHKKRVIDVGTGSGLLGLFAAKKGGIVTAVDINPLAVTTCQRNAAENGLSLNIIESDLFDALPSETTYDCVMINPPYFAANPKDAAARAFFAGENLEYFAKLFQQLPSVIHAGTRIWMILCDDCDLDTIHQMATINGFEHTVLFEKTKWGKRMQLIQYWKMLI
jgi:release factor glutamine methyltransferase